MFIMSFIQKSGEYAVRRRERNELEYFIRENGTWTRNQVKSDA
ncbi:hypothetical protein EDWATA_00652 [Edwardsiella tarda ATCC 23685]|uniref:Uncharacterized protein n=1 Tax=Edwardsiella tarda ATCC 23685 TaxID=500638 RepID=D4F1Q9_EDWTA|nr:hypothetical protein EDWATA_00652 [Edwardsiella tarda ATCC 23685]